MGATESVSYKISLEDYFSKGLQGAESSAMRFQSRIDSIGDHLSKLKGQLMTAFAGYKLFEYGSKVVDATTRFETLNNVINYTSGSAREAAANHEFLNRIIKDYRLPLESTTEGYSQFMASVMGSAIEGEKARKVYEGVAIASTAMHLSAQQNESVFLALNQMMSKGKVQAQELTLQLGQALPGAMRLASNSMGMTTAEFMKHMEKGEISSADFLPKFADELRKQFAGAIPNAINSLQARRNAMDNEWLGLKLDLGQAFFPMIETGIHYMSELAKTLREAAVWMRENITLVKSIAVGVASAAISYKALEVGISVYNGYLLAQKAAIGELTFVQYAWNAAVSVSPIGLLAAAIGVATASVYGYIQSLQDYDDAINGAKLSQDQLKSAVSDELVYLREKTAEIREQKKLTEEQAMAMAVSDAKFKLLTDYNDAQKKYSAAFDEDNNQELGKQLKRMNTIKAQLDNLGSKDIYKQIAGASTGTKPSSGTASSTDLGSGISEPKASRIQNITFNLNQPFQNQKITMGGGNLNVNDLAPRFAEWIISLVTDASIVATE